MSKCIKMTNGKVLGFTIDNKIDIDFSSPADFSYLSATGILDLVSDSSVSTNEVMNLLYKYKLIDYNADYESSFIGLPNNSTYSDKYKLISQSLNFRNYINRIASPLSFSTIELGEETTTILNQIPRGSNLTIDASSFSNYVDALIDNLSPDSINDATPQFIYDKVIQDSILLQDLRYFLNSVSKMISGDMVMEFTNMSENAYQVLILHVNDYLDTYNNKSILPLLKSFPKFRNRTDLVLEMEIAIDSDTNSVLLYSTYQKSNEVNTYSLTDDGKVSEFRGSIRNRVISKSFSNYSESIDQSLTREYSGNESSYYNEFKDSYPDFFKDIASINNLLSKKPHAVLLSDLTNNLGSTYTGDILQYYDKFYPSVLSISWNHENGTGIIFNKKDYENRARNANWDFRLERRGIPAIGYPKYISVIDQGVIKTINIGKVIGGDIVLLNNELVETVKDYNGKGIHPLLYIVLSGGTFEYDNTLSQDNIDYTMKILTEPEDINFMLNKLTGYTSDHHNVYNHSSNNGINKIGMEFVKVNGSNRSIIDSTQLNVYNSASEFFINKYKENGDIMEALINKIHTYNNENNSNFIVVNEEELFNKVSYLNKIPDWESIINDEDFIKSLIC